MSNLLTIKVRGEPEVKQPPPRNLRQMEEDKLPMKVQSGDISICHFQYGGDCLHFTRASFNTVCGKSNFKLTLLFSEMTLHFSYII